MISIGKFIWFLLTIKVVSSIYSLENELIDLLVSFPEEIEIRDIYEPDISRLRGGEGYILSLYRDIYYMNKHITFNVYCRIDKDQIPYSHKSIALLKSVFEEKKYKDYSLFSDNVIYYRYLETYTSFVDVYKARDIKYIPQYKSDIIYGQDGTNIERDYTIGIWPYSGAEDRLTYYLKDDKGLYSEYIIEFYGIWNAFFMSHDKLLLEPVLSSYDPSDSEYINYLYTLTNEELDAYPDQDDPSIRLLHLLNEAMATFRFKERPNAPPANLALVNDNRVRLRSDYTLEGDILGHVNTGEEVIVMEQSPRQETIGNQTSYWYKVVSKESYIKGWMFGSFLDFIEE